MSASQPSSAPQNPLSPQGAFPAGAGAPAPGPAPSKAPKLLIIIGSVILALSVIVGVVLAVVGIGGVAGSADDLEQFPSGAGTVVAEEGDSLQIYVPEGFPPPTCDVMGPAVGEGTGQSSTTTAGGTTWVSVHSFTAEAAGEYSIDCGGLPIAVGPPVSILGIFAGIGGILLALGGGFLGFVLLALGVILLLVRRSKA
ncbi:hypothetical protein [Brachybacterium sp. UNK5269]|uniref:hypothetical protein n=1 Tax=Brachybacterium sp. UNK5269 TaxID=3408576 RepID=UPI003BAFB434